MVAVLAWLVVAWNDSRVPDRFGALGIGTVDYGGASPPRHRHGVSVAALHGSGANPDVRVRLVAQHAEVRLPSGRVVRALTFNATLPGPELRVHEGDLVEATLVNRDLDEGISIHWHGVDLPNAEDGVSGVTQDAVEPGESYVYRFRAPVAGTYWYHSHQHSAARSSAGSTARSSCCLGLPPCAARGTSSRSRTRSAPSTCSAAPTASGAYVSQRTRRFGCGS